MIFFDTNVIVDFFIKKFNNGENNPRHFRAVRLWNSSEDVKVICNLIRIEVLNLLYLKHQKSKDLIRKVNTGILNDFVIIDDSDYFDEGFKKLQEFDERFSINDCICLAIMEDYGINEIVSFNSDFDYSQVRRFH